MPYFNPFPAHDGPIGEEFFVGRSDIIQKFQDFLLRDSDERSNEVWIISGERGQGKSSLFQKLTSLVAESHTDCALGCFTWLENHEATFPLARELYGAIVRYRLKGQRTVPLFRGGLRYYLGNLLSFASYSQSGVKVSLSSLAPKPRNGVELVNLLASSLSDGVGTVVFMIDEVSAKPPDPAPPFAAEKTKILANSVRNTPITNAQRGLNILTLVFLQPKDLRAFDAKNYGPRASVPLVLEDFRKTDVEDLIHHGLTVSNVRAQRQNLAAVSAEISEVAAAVEAWTGGVPTLTVALLCDAFKQMVVRVEEGAPPMLTAADVEDCVKNGKTPLVDLRIRSLMKYFQMPSDAGLQGDVRRLLGAFAAENYGTGGWKEGVLRRNMQETVGKSTLANRSIDACLKGLLEAPFLLRNGEEFRFRGRLVMNRLLDSLE